MKIERFVTEWGFPAMHWRDRVTRMWRTQEYERWLWVAHDGAQVMMSGLGNGGPVRLGRWDEWQSLAIGQSQDDLPAYELSQLRSGKVHFVDHLTLNAHFGPEGGARRMAVSAVSRSEMQRLHDAIWRTFIAGRVNYTPPEDGVCWRKHFERTDEPLHADEMANRAKVEMTTLNVGLNACRSIEPMCEPPMPAIHWREPVATSGMLGGRRYHRVLRNLWVGRGFRPGMRELSFNSYKPGAEGVVVINADFALLKGFRVVDSRETNAKALQPIRGTLPGLSMVADFRYGLTLPLTCATYAPGVDGRANLEQFREILHRLFMPLVGQTLTDEQVGLPAKPS